ncbi:MAG: alginate export family protein [Alphaproteobacteria bacterium]|nr:alginate export family protein [Alphaproteobacteria bacterium]
MKRSGLKFLTVSSLILSGSLLPDTAHAEPDVKFSANLKAQALSSNDLDLGTADTNGTDSQSLELKAKLEGDLTHNLSFLLEARGVKNYGEGGSIDTDTGEVSGRDDYLELRQYWMEYHGINGLQPLGIRVGRQRFREDYGLWWNRDFDAVRLFYDATLIKSFLAVGQNLGEYRTSGDAFNNDDEDILRVVGETSWQWKLDQFLEGRVLYQNDHSGLEDIGDRLNADDYDSQDADILWFGVRAAGTLPESRDLPAVKNTKYRVDLIGMVGSEDRLTTTAVGVNERLVTGHEDSDLSAWALDAGLDVPVTLFPNVAPVIHVGYAYGSGDSDPNDNDDHAFRQTDLDSNSSHLAGFPSSINNYGSVLRPDLSNLHIATAGVEVPVTKALDISGFYRYYALADADAALPSNGIDASVNGRDSDLGQGFDLIVNFDVNEQFDYDPVVADKINLKTTLGGFRAGDAYGDAEGETAVRAQIDLNIKF